MSQPRFLLMVACSQRKRLTPEPLPALQRYSATVALTLALFKKPQQSSPQGASVQRCPK